MFPLIRTIFSLESLGRSAQHGKFTSKFIVKGNLIELLPLWDILGQKLGREEGLVKTAKI